MKGYVARKRDRYYAVIYDGLDPVTGRERRSWHPAGWHAFQSAERRAVGIEDSDQMFTAASGEPVHPNATSQAFDRIVRRAGVPIISLHGLRHTHGSLLVEAGVPVKVVTERLGHAREVFTIETYQHVMPGMQAKAASTFETLMTPSVLPKPGSTGVGRENNRKKTA